MKPDKNKERFIELRAAGPSYEAISKGDRGLQSLEAWQENRFA